MNDGYETTILACCGLLYLSSCHKSSREVLQRWKLYIFQQSYRPKLKLVAACVLLQKCWPRLRCSPWSCVWHNNQAGLHSGFAASDGETQAPQKVCLSEEGQVVELQRLQQDLVWAHHCTCSLASAQACHVCCYGTITCRQWPCVPTQKLCEKSAACIKQILGWPSSQLMRWLGSLPVLRTYVRFWPEVHGILARNKQLLLG